MPLNESELKTWKEWKAAQEVYLWARQKAYSDLALYFYAEGLNPQSSSMFELHGRICRILDDMEPDPRRK